MSEPMNPKPLCRPIVKKTYTKICEREGCGNVFTTSVLSAKYCKDAECHRLVMNLNNARIRQTRIPKKRAKTKSVKIRAEAKSVPSAQKWLSMPMRKP